VYQYWQYGTLTAEHGPLNSGIILLLRFFQFWCFINF
jgi:hypothetical protein